MRALALFALAACGGDDAPATVVYPTVLDIPVVANHQLDLLFMIDDSLGMADRQATLASAFPKFLAALASAPGGLPVLHLGAVTSDLGTSAADGTNAPDTGSNNAGGCNGQGRGAVMKGGFVSGVSDPDELARDFTSMALTGSVGCGFEQSLEASKRALAANPGFVRAAAQLAIVLFTDEDDCSLAHSAILTSDTATYGPFASFRCTRFGVTCDDGGATPDAMNQPGTKGRCHANDSGADLASVADYASFFTALKPDPRDVLVASMTAPTTPFAVADIASSNGGPVQPQLLHACTGEITADPAVRVHQLVDAVGGIATTICDPDLAPGLVHIARAIDQRLGSPCLETAVADCLAYDEVDGALTEIAACPAGPPCWTLDADPATCPDADHLKLSVTRDASPPAGAHVVLKCRTGG